MLLRIGVRSIDLDYCHGNIWSPLTCTSICIPDALLHLALPPTIVLVDRHLDDLLEFLLELVEIRDPPNTVRTIGSIWESVEFRERDHPTSQTIVAT